MQTYKFLNLLETNIKHTAKYKKKHINKKYLDFRDMHDRELNRTKSTNILIVFIFTTVKN